MTAPKELPEGAVLEYETTYYTDWRCSVCSQWRSRNDPVRLVVTRVSTRLMCQSHGPDEDEDEDEECTCHCHDYGVCSDCGEPV